MIKRLTYIKIEEIQEQLFELVQQGWNLTSLSGRNRQFTITLSRGGI